MLATETLRLPRVTFPELNFKPPVDLSRLQQSAQDALDLAHKDLQHRLEKNIVRLEKAAQDALDRVYVGLETLGGAAQYVADHPEILVAGAKVLGKSTVNNLPYWVAGYVARASMVTVVGAVPAAMIGSAAIGGVRRWNQVGQELEENGAERVYENIVTKRADVVKQEGDNTLVYLAKAGVMEVFGGGMDKRTAQFAYGCKARQTVAEIRSGQRQDTTKEAYTEGIAASSIAYLTSTKQEERNVAFKTLKDEYKGLLAKETPVSEREANFEAKKKRKAQIRANLGQAHKEAGQQMRLALAVSRAIQAPLHTFFGPKVIEAGKGALGWLGDTVGHLANSASENVHVLAPAGLAAATIQEQAAAHIAYPPPSPEPFEQPVFPLHQAPVKTDWLPQVASRENLPRELSVQEQITLKTANLSSQTGGSGTVHSRMPGLASMLVEEPKSPAVDTSTEDITESLDRARTITVTIGENGVGTYSEAMQQLGVDWRGTGSAAQFIDEFLAHDKNIATGDKIALLSAWKNEPDKFITFAQFWTKNRPLFAVPGLDLVQNGDTVARVVEKSQGAAGFVKETAKVVTTARENDWSVRGEGRAVALLDEMPTTLASTDIVNTPDVTSHRSIYDQITANDGDYTFGVLHPAPTYHGAVYDILSVNDANNQPFTAVPPIPSAVEESATLYGHASTHAISDADIPLRAAYPAATLAHVPTEEAVNPEVAVEYNHQTGILTIGQEKFDTHKPVRLRILRSSHGISMPDVPLKLTYNPQGVYDQTLGSYEAFFWVNNQGGIVVAGHSGYWEGKDLQPFEGLRYYLEGNRSGTRDYPGIDQVNQRLHILKDVDPLEIGFGHNDKPLAGDPDEAVVALTGAKIERSFNYLTSVAERVAASAELGGPKGTISFVDCSRSHLDAVEAVKNLLPDILRDTGLDNSTKLALAADFYIIEDAKTGEEVRNAVYHILDWLKKVDAKKYQDIISHYDNSGDVNGYGKQYSNPDFYKALYTILTMTPRSGPLS